MHCLICNTSNFSWDKKTRTLLGSAELLKLNRFPDELLMGSAHTGVTAVFKRDEGAAIRNEYWDGEEMHYVSMDPSARGVKVVIGRF